jgi:hypothetical protein
MVDGWWLVVGGWYCPYIKAAAIAEGSRWLNQLNHSNRIGVVLNEASNRQSERLVLNTVY